MIVPRDVLVRHGIVDSPRVCALPPTVQLFFRNILHVCDGAGRFLTDADELRRALYGRSPGVQCSHVDAWLQKIYLAGLVKLYTKGARGYGEVLNFGQRDTKRKVLYPADSDEELNFAPRVGAEDDPPPLLKEEMNRREGKGKCARRTESPAPKILSRGVVPVVCQSAWIDELRGRWPGIELEKELAAASTSRRKIGKELERGWFELYWLPKCTAKVDVREVGRKQAEVVSEPANWRELIADTAYGPGAAMEVAAWREVPRDVRDYIIKQAREVLC